MKPSGHKILKQLGLTLVGEKKHLKCKDEYGKTYILSKDYIRQALDNPRFAKVTHKSLWLKNRKGIFNEEIQKQGFIPR